MAISHYVSSTISWAENHKRIDFGEPLIAFASARPPENEYRNASGHHPKTRKPFEWFCNKDLRQKPAMECEKQQRRDRITESSIGPLEIRTLDSQSDHRCSAQ